MKTLILIVCFLLSGRILAYADVGIGNVQAICKIQLKDGKEVIGFISICVGGYDYYRPDGFCFKRYDGYIELNLFNLDFRELIPENSGKLYFVKNLLHQPAQTTIRNYSETDKILLIKTEQQSELQLLDTITIYLNLPPGMYVGTILDKKEDILKIAMKDIKSFELLEFKDPTEEWRYHDWILKIEIARKNNTGGEDYLEPYWYHEVRKNKEMYDYLKQNFSYIQGYFR